jgi:hypothetical protein
MVLTTCRKNDRIYQEGDKKCMVKCLLVCPRVTTKAFFADVTKLLVIFIPKPVSHLSLCLSLNKHIHYHMYLAHQIKA